jgi:holo-[acyl-carrier protein] synthase
MDIIGTGIDATEISRIAASIERYGDRFINRIYTEGEVAYCRASGTSPHRLPPGRAKEAV